MAGNRTLEAIVSIAGQLDPSLQRSLTSATKQFSGLKIGVAAVGTAAVATAAAVVKFGVEAVKSAAEFEQSMANVASLLDGSQAQIAKRVEELGADVIKVSNELGVTTEDLSDGLYKIISAVGDSEDAITQMELAAKVAAAGGTETTEAIDLLTAVTKGYNDTSGEAFQKAADLAFMTDKLGQTSVPELAKSIGKVIPLSAALGVEQEELFGSFAALTGVTGSTAEVATQMKAVMSGLMSPTDDMTKSLEMLGYENSNAALEALGFQGMLDALGETVGGDTQELAKLFSSVEAQTAILALAGAQSEDLTEKTLAMYDATGAADAAFETRTDTLEHTIAVIKNLGKNFVTSIGQKILPVVKEVAEKLLPLVETGLGKLEPLVGGLYEGLSPVIKVFGGLAGKVLPMFEGYLSALGDAWGLVGPELQKIADVIMPPINKVFDKFGEIFNKLQPVFGEFVSTLIPQIGSLIQSLAPVLDVVTAAMFPILDMVGEFVASLLPAITNTINFLIPIVKLLAHIIAAVLSNAFKFLMPIIENFMNVLTGICDFVSNVFTGNWSGAWESVKSIFSNAFQAIEGLANSSINGVISIINGVVQGINNVGFTIPDWVPVVGGKAFKINIPEIPMLATGGFTTGPSIAGEAGTEAVISFNRAQRAENLSYWAKAGRMLGVNDNMLTAFERGSTSSGDNISFTFAPQITINGTGDVKEDIIAAIKREEDEFMDLIEEMLSRRGGERYVYG